MKQSLLYYFIPLFIGIYFVISTIPVIRKAGSEIFPFFSFRLYSKVPTKIDLYDVICDYRGAHPYLLLTESDTLTQLERKHFFHKINKIGIDYEKYGQLNCEEITPLLIPTTSIAFVRLSGDYIEAVRDKKYNVEVIQVIDLKP